MAPGIGMSNWVAVASAEHVAIGRAGGFMQVGHGKGIALVRNMQEVHAGHLLEQFAGDAAR